MADPLFLLGKHGASTVTEVGPSRHHRHRCNRFDRRRREKQWWL